MTKDDERGEGGKKCRKFDDVILCERPLTNTCPVTEILKVARNLKIEIIMATCY